MKLDRRFAARTFCAIALVALLACASSQARGNEFPRVYITEGEVVSGGIIDDDGVIHHFIVDADTFGPNGFSNIAIYVEGTRFIVFSVGSDGTGDTPAYAEMVIIYYPTGLAP